MSNALLLVPPFLNLAFGPLSGPTMLVSAAEAAGHRVVLMDINERWLRPRLTISEPRRYLGDHDCPLAMRELRAQFNAEVGVPEGRTHAAIHASASAIVGSTFGSWFESQLATVTAIPDVIGVSLMYRDQLEVALAITAIAKRRFPEALVIWGGAHVTAMRREIAHDARYGRGIDGFVFGYAEQTWVDILNAVGAGAALPFEVARAGVGRQPRAREDLTVVPTFDTSQFLRERLTIPLQTSRGCTYAACSFCTYPNVEGEHRRVPDDIVRAAIERAIGLGASLSFKDSLLEGERLLDVARWVAGRAEWSACTKLDRLLPSRLPAIARGGCRTLEVGLETVHPPAQQVARKKQTWRDIVAFLDAAEAAEIAVIVNYIVGFPGCDPASEQACLEAVQSELSKRPGLVARVESHPLQVERLSYMGQRPRDHEIEVVGEAPWSSILEWRYAPKLVTIRSNPRLTRRSRRLATPIPRRVRRR